MSIYSFWSLKILLRSNMEIKSVHCGSKATSLERAKKTASSVKKKEKIIMSVSNTNGYKQTFDLGK